ncbi:MAG: hypothetical protein WCI11_14435 [Candidatus Methylumidiphilus sp.]
MPESSHRDVNLRLTQGTGASGMLPSMALDTVILSRYGEVLGTG